jgi:hypothetical protein
MKNNKKTNFSKISQELFDSITLSLTNTEHLYYATFERADKEGYINKEYVLKLSNFTVKPDFIMLDKNKIIEFDGDYCHSPAVCNVKREQERDKVIVESGYSMLRVEEFNYKKDKQKCIEECLEFLQNGK